jgi:hypothetical protein
MVEMPKPHSIDSGTGPLLKVSGTVFVPLVRDMALEDPRNSQVPMLCSR